MEKDNKIISFTKNRKKSEYRLKTQISIHICRKNTAYSIEWDSPDSNISEEEIYCILKKILKELSVEIKKITYKVHDSYEISFTILYYEANSKKSKYICIPQNLKKEKLAEYLYISTCIYEKKKHGVLS